MSSCEEYLTAENIAMALTRQITMNPTEPDVAFAVMEIASEYSNICEAK
jgi:hypothetical protein